VTLRINFFTGSSEVDYALYYMRLGHGLSHITAWTIIIPAGAFIGRYKPGGLNAGKDPQWMKIHRSIQIFGAFVTCCAFVLAFIMTTTHYATPWHAQVNCAYFDTCSTCCPCCIPTTPSSKWR